MSVAATRHGRIGHILLDRPKALNALDLGMIHAMSRALDTWRDDPAVHAVVIEGAGERAFCAGGDIRAVRDAVLAGDAGAVERFFADEYALNLAIAEYPKPYVALIDGICMGGGVGVSVHGAYRVVTEAAMIAMPETAIAMFPDVGATHVLPRLPGALGMYLGLTGTRLVGADAVHGGIATHFVPRAALPGLRDALARDGVAALAAAAAPLPAFSLQAHRDAIERCVGADSVPELIARLHDEDNWGSATLAILRAMSPSAVFWSFAMIRRGAGLTLRAALQAELAMTRQVALHPDLAEGVRAMVVDKDRTPKWTPLTLEAVDEAKIAAMLGGA